MTTIITAAAMMMMINMTRKITISAKASKGKTALISLLRQPQQQSRRLCKISPSSSSSSSSSLFIRDFSTSTTATATGTTTSKSDGNDILNKGSIARDILAAERTFLAWARTGLGFVGSAVALFATYHQHDETISKQKQNNNQKMNSNNNNDNKNDTDTDADMMVDKIFPACAILVLNGSFILGFATRRYVKLVSALKNNSSILPIGSIEPLIAVAFTAIGTITSLFVVASARIRNMNNDKSNNKNNMNRNEIDRTAKDSNDNDNDNDSRSSNNKNENEKNDGDDGNKK